MMDLLVVFIAVEVIMAMTDVMLWKKQFDCGITLGRR
jgi:hypothetical protein